MKDCSHRTVSVAYPKHLPTPEDLLHFVESTDFTEDWTALGLDAEDDLLSLQLCIMAQPEGDCVVEGTNGLRVHRHRFQRPSGVQAVTAYYAHFADFGVVYLNVVDTGREKLRFTPEELLAINESLKEVEVELERLKTIRVRKQPTARQGGGSHE